MELVERRAWIRDVLEQERLNLQEHLDGHFEDVSFKLQQAFTNMTDKLLTQDSYMADKIQRHQVGNDEPPSITNNSACFENVVENTELVHCVSNVSEDEFARNETMEAKLAKHFSKESETPSSRGQRNRISHWGSAEIKGLMGKRPTKADPNTFRGRLERMLHGPFNAVVCFLILLNVVVAFARLQELGNRANRSLGEEYWDWPHATFIFYVLETVFTLIFVVELVIRIYVYQRWFFSEHLNLLDLFVVSVTAVHLLVLSIDQEPSDEREWLRLLAVVRTARILRTMRYLKELRVILDTMLGSLAAVFWSILLMVMFQWMMAMLLCQALHGFIIDVSQDLDARRWINTHYGSGWSSFYTLFEATFSGCWPNYFRPVMNYVSPYFGVPIAAYVIVVIFTMSRIVSALFLRETLRQASDQAEVMVRERKKETGAVTRKLHGIFMAADTSGDGLLTEDEMSRMLEHEKVRILLSKLGLEASDGHVLFGMLNDGTGSINLDEFLSGIKHLKGEARSIDLIPLIQNCNRILENCRALRARQEEGFLRQQGQQNGHGCLMANGCDGLRHQALHQQRTALMGRRCECVI